MVNICGLYLGGETLSCLSLKFVKKKGWSVESGGVEMHTACCETDDLSPIMKSLCKTMKLSSGEATLVLPKQQGILRNVQLPSTEREELSQMARFEAERHIPFHAERHSTGFHVMRSMGLEGSDVILGAMDGPVVQRALDSLNGTGLSPRGITLSSVALVNSLIHGKREWMKEKTVVLLNVGLDALDIAIIHDGRLVFARSVSMDLRRVLEGWIGFALTDGSTQRPGAAKLAVAARMIDCMNLEGHYGQAGAAASKDAAASVRAWIDRIIQEIRRTYDFARREMKCPPVDAVALTGEGALLRNLSQYLFVNLNIEVQVFNPVAALGGPAVAKFPFEGLEFAIPFGAAISRDLEGAYQLDLTPTEYYRQVARKRTLRQLITTAILLVVTLGLGVASYLRLQEIRGDQLAAYEKVNVKMKPRVAELDEMRAKLKIIRNFMDDPNSALVVLNSMASASTLPSRVALLSITYEKGSDIVIEGQAKGIPDISAFVQELRNTGKFLEIVVADQSPDRLFEQPIYRFKLDCPLAVSEKGSDRKGGSRK